MSVGVIILVIHVLLLVLFFLDEKQPKKHRFINPLFLFLSLWTVITAASCIHIYDITPPSDQAYILIGLMSTFFFLGCFIRVRLPLANKKKERHFPKISEPTLKKVFYIAGALILIFNLIDCFIVLSNAFQGTPLWQIRNWSLAPIGSDNPILNRRSAIENIFRKIVLTPLSAIIIPISFYFFFHDKSAKKRFIPVVFSFIIMFTSAVAGAGGRLGFILYFIYGIFAYILYRKKHPKKKRKFLWGCLAIAALISFVIGTTIFRSGFGNFFRQSFTYITLAPTLLTLWLPIISSKPSTYGLLTTFGVHSYIFRGLKALGFSSLVPAAFDSSFEIMMDAESWMPIGYRNANAFVSPIYYFMADGGPLFVCIASIIFGFIIYNFFLKCENKKNYSLKDYCLLCLVNYGVLVSFMRIQTVIPSFILSLLFSMFLPNNEELSS